MIKRLKTIFRKDVENLSTGEYFKLRKIKLSITFITSITVLLVIIAPVIFLVLKNTIAGICDLTVLFVAIIALILTIYNHETIGSALLMTSLTIFLTTLVYMILFFFYKDSPVAIYSLVTIFSLTMISMMPAGILINAMYVFIQGLIYSIAFSIIIKLYDDPLLTSRIPLLFGAFTAAGIIIALITRTQNNLLKIAISESITSKEKVEEINKIVIQISDLRTQITSSQNLVSEQLVKIDEIIKLYSSRVEVLSDHSNQLTGEVETTRKDLELFTHAIDNTADKVQTQILITEKHTKSQATITNSIVKIKNNVKIANRLNMELNENAESGTNAANKTLEAISSLETYQDKMMVIITILSDISAKTNLLAMNASIEAAHAGSAGSGFNIVANEIRKLADGSGKQTKEITNIINEMNSQIQNSTDLINKISTILLTIIEKGKESYPVINEISQNMDELLENNQDTQQGTEELVVISQQIHENSTKEKEIADSFTTTFQTLKGYFDNLNEIVGNLTEYSKKSDLIMLDISNIRKENSQVENNINSLLDSYSHEQ